MAALALLKSAQNKEIIRWQLKRSDIWEQGSYGKSGLAERGTGHSYPGVGGTQRGGFQPISNTQRPEKKICCLASAVTGCTFVLSLWVSWIPLPSDFTRKRIDPASSHLPALAARTNTARGTRDQVMLRKAMVQKRCLSSYLLYIFKCFVVFGLSFLDF